MGYHFGAFRCGQRLKSFSFHNLRTCTYGLVVRRSSPPERRRRPQTSLGRRGDPGRAGSRPARPSCSRSFYVDPEINLLVGFEKRRTRGPKGMLTAPDLYGASGCGLWRFGRHIRDAVNPPRLAAIGVRWEARGRVKHIAGTRIQLVLSGIADRYADARIAIDRHSKAFPWHPLQVSPMGTARTK